MRSSIGNGGGGRARRSYSYASTLPTTTSHKRSHTISCWYCDLKITAFNQYLYSFGRRHAKLLRLWFSIGTGFGLTALLALTMILLGELVATLNLVDSHFQNFFRNILFGFLPSPSGFILSIMDFGLLLFSTLISVAAHEFGHAVAAASEGIQIEYIAVYVAAIFPGALVAFNYDSLQNLPQLRMLRIYCAGIWHNAVCSAVCVLVLLLLPMILYPLYVHGENLVVLDVKSTSPLSAYLSPGDIIESVDGLKIHDNQRWVERMDRINEQSLQNSPPSNDSLNSKEISGVKGYCIPTAWLEDEKFQMEPDRSSCPGGLAAFSNVPCFDLNELDEKFSDGHRNTIHSRQCFNAWDVVQLKKCGEGWLGNGTGGSHCMCSQEEACLRPVMVPGLTWIEITYRRPYWSECLLVGRNSSSVLGNPGTINCGGTFVYIGDVPYVKDSVVLSAYQPRLVLKWALGLPKLLEKLLLCTFHVSLTLALLNCLPVFLLDGESILEATIDCIPFLNSRKRARALQLCLLGGTFLSILAFSRVLLDFL